MVKLNENASCSRCKWRGDADGDYFMCIKRGKVKPSDVCKKYVFDPFSKQVNRKRRFDASMFDPLDFDINL